MNKILIIGVIGILLGTTILPVATTHTIQTNSLTRINNNGNTLYVGGPGPNNYTKIQDAIDNASNGDTVFVYDDSSPYLENVIIDKPLNLMGEDKETTTIDGNERGIVIHIKESACNTKIVDFTIRNGGRGLWIIAPHCTLQDNIIQHNGMAFFIESDENYLEDNIIINNSDANFEYSNQNTLKNNTFIDTDYYGIKFLYSHQNIIEKNVFQRSRLDLEFSGDNKIHDNIFIKTGITYTEFSFGYNNDISNNTVNGKPLVYLVNQRDEILDVDAGQILMRNCTNITIHNQNISDTTFPIYIYNSHLCNIINVTLCNSEVGIWIEQSNHIQVKDSQICDNFVGMEIYRDDKITLENNYIDNRHYTEDTSTGIEMIFTNNSKVYGNTIRNNFCGIWMGECYGNTIHHNSFLYNIKHAIFVNCLFNIWLRNYWNNWHLPLPRPILGTLYGYQFIMPWICFDWCPRLLPYRGELDE